MREHIAMVAFLVVVAASFGQLHIQETYQQSVKTSTLYTTQTITFTTRQTLLNTRTGIVTVTVPPPPDFEVRYRWTSWYYTGYPDYAYKVELQGNVTNKSDQTLWNVRLTFEAIENDKSQFIYNLVAVLNPWETKSFHFDGDLPQGKFLIKWLTVRYRGVDNYNSPTQTTTFVRTTTMTQPTTFEGAMTLTTVNKVEVTYTESGPSMIASSPNIIGIAVIVTIGAAAVVVLAVFVFSQRKKVTTAATPPGIASP